MSKEVVWTNFGLDGAGAYLVLKWLRSQDIEVHYTTPRRFRDDFIKWQVDAGTTTYSKIFILNLDLARSIDIADLSNCVIIDNHKSHIDKKDLYLNARTAIVDATSTTRLLFRIFKSELIKKLTPAQILLVSLIDDYISGENKKQQSKLLNAAYWCNSGDKIQKFVQDFTHGFHGFNDLQKNAINIYFKRLNQMLNELDVFEGRIPFQQQSLRVFSTFAQGSYEEVTQHLLHTYGADIALIVNLSTKTVFFRKSKECTIPLQKLAERLCDGGGGDTFAGGDVTDKFMEFCKTLRQVC